jgi:tRNA G18 (ribose-2'-O)-methylase SpoU
MMEQRQWQSNPNFFIISRVARFEHLRHLPPSVLERPRELVVACAPLRSHINVSHILRTAGCCGVTRVIACGAAKVIERIARDGADTVQLEVHRTLPPVLKQLKQDGYTLVGLEQTTNSESIYEFAFPRKMVLVVGNERLGLTPEELQWLDRVVEIPVYGLPHSYNVHTSTAMALYEYCKQYPRG